MSEFAMGEISGERIRDAFNRGFDTGYATACIEAARALQAFPEQRRDLIVAIAYARMFYDDQVPAADDPEVMGLLRVAYDAGPPYA